MFFLFLSSRFHSQHNYHQVTRGHWEQSNSSLYLKSLKHLLKLHKYNNTQYKFNIIENVEGKV